jgi:hypothetical protein
MHPLTEEQKRKDNCRHIAGYYRRRGILQQQPCERCGSMLSQMHHDDYSKPLEVTWLCRACHLALHREEEIKMGSALTMKDVVRRFRKGYAL